METSQDNEGYQTAGRERNLPNVFVRFSPKWSMVNMHLFSLVRNIRSHENTILSQLGSVSVIFVRNVCHFKNNTENVTSWKNDTVLLRLRMS